MCVCVSGCAFGSVCIETRAVEHGVVSDCSVHQHLGVFR